MAPAAVVRGRAQRLEKQACEVEDALAKLRHVVKVMMEERVACKLLMDVGAVQPSAQKPSILAQSGIARESRLTAFQATMLEGAADENGRINPWVLMLAQHMETVGKEWGMEEIQVPRSQTGARSEER